MGVSNNSYILSQYLGLPVTLNMCSKRDYVPLQRSIPLDAKLYFLSTRQNCLSPSG